MARGLGLNLATREQALVVVRFHRRLVIGAVTV